VSIFIMSPNYLRPYIYNEYADNYKIKVCERIYVVR